MLGKLLKYEIPALGRKLIPLYGAWAAASALMGFSLRSVHLDANFFTVISILLYVAVTVAVFVMAIILIVQRYRKSMLGDEAYFNIALPVSMNEHIANKTISALIWMTVTTIAAIISVFVILLCSGELITMLRDADFALIYREIMSAHGGKTYLLLLELLIAGVFSTSKSILAIYAALTIGHQAKERTTLASIGAYIGLMMAESVIGNILIRVGALMQMGIRGFEEFLLNHSFAVSQLFMLFMILIAAGLMTGYFFICKYFMEKRLNLN